MKVPRYVFDIPHVNNVYSMFDYFMWSLFLAEVTTSDILQ